MQPYANLSGKSGIAAFEILHDGIKIRFVNGGTYLYDYCTPGRTTVEKMKRLASTGRGLSTYISRYGGEYAEKIS
ncbi:MULTISPECIES: hypothetical protein [unclassified Caballeronia]|jgi:hypothetical protein|uniref:hypothetical protein n=1 Tax=unclassified Caballeronia TaxID=2646786 RepID=UPI001FD3918B|nr:MULTISPECIES: hypothetical protein [unclassified Caballeronia]MDR5771241.1 hypothetical protein [Caballeronia sp. LZ002]MDR5846677.1 hypothetical protein [Caballeronia sp. LZ003]